MCKFEKMQKILFTCFCFLCHISFVFNQEIIRNSDKEWILVYKDGTFRQLDFEQESDLQKFEEKILSDSTFQKFDYDEDNFYYRKSYILNEKCNFLKFNSEMTYNEALKNKELIEAELNKAKSENEKEEIKKLKKLFSEANKTEQSTYKQKNVILKKCSEYYSILNMSPQNRKETLNKNYKIVYKGDQKNPNYDITELKLDNKDQDQQSKSSEEKTSEVAENQPKKTIDPVKFKHEDVINNPPFKKYKIVVDSIDNFTKKNRKELEKDLLFSYTDESLKNFQKTRDYIICEAYMTKIPGFITLNLEININSINTTNQFGSIDRGSYLLVKLINGENIKLYCNRTDKGQLNPVEGVTIYRTTYIIDTTSESDLKKYEVDKIRLIWSTGYDEYDITNMDFFINQIKSLN